MELKAFIGAIVYAPQTKRRFTLTSITAPEIGVMAVEPDARGIREHYVYRTMNGDPISNGILVFEDPALTVPFQAAYRAYCSTEEAYWESYGYWMHRD